MATTLLPPKSNILLFASKILQTANTIHGIIPSSAGSKIVSSLSKINDIATSPSTGSLITAMNKINGITNIPAANTILEKINNINNLTNLPAATKVLDAMDKFHGVLSVLGNFPVAGNVAPETEVITPAFVGGNKYDDVINKIDMSQLLRNLALPDDMKNVYPLVCGNMETLFEQIKTQYNSISPFAYPL